MKKLIAGTGILITLLQLGAIPVFAALWPSEYERVTDPDVLISNAIRLVFILAGVVVLLFLMMGGFQWITSGGDKANTEAARNKITAAIIGMAIIALSYIVIKIVGVFFGIDILGGNILWRINQFPNAAS
jgi:succinate dehydrogenase hydrophobic anchor subunit